MKVLLAAFYFAFIRFNLKGAKTMPSGKNGGKNLSNELTEDEKIILLELINNPRILYMIP